MVVESGNVKEIHFQSSSKNSTSLIILIILDPFTDTIHHQSNLIPNLQPCYLSSCWLLAHGIVRRAPEKTRSGSSLMAGININCYKSQRLNWDLATTRKFSADMPPIAPL
jgi:hypothetical protein